MTVRELYGKLCEIIPSSLSCEWDRDGLECCPEPEKEVKKVIISLDVTKAVIDLAEREGALSKQGSIPAGYTSMASASHYPAFIERAAEPITANTGISAAADTDSAAIYETGILLSSFSFISVCIVPSGKNILIYCYFLTTFHYICHRSHQRIGCRHIKKAFCLYLGCMI